MKNIFKALPYIKIIFVMYVTKVLSFFYKKKTDTWLVCERGMEARDNAYFFFLYLRDNHPEIDSKFLISKTSSDRTRLVKFQKDLINYNSIRNYITYWNANTIVSTHIATYIPADTYRFTRLDKIFKFTKNKRIIFLQHGIIKDYLPQLFGDRIKLDLFCCGAYEEYQYILKNFKHPAEVVRYTGLCRYDNLTECQTKDYILVMPTWRMYIDKSKFIDSQFYKAYSELLTDSRLVDILHANNLKLVFYPHFELQDQMHLFKRLPLDCSIVLADFKYDVQTLLKEAKLLVTDYSSVYFDFVYMKKPIVNYQFDSEEFYSNHYQKGYINGGAFGPIVDNVENLIEEINNIITNKYTLSKNFATRVDTFFQRFDNHNCDRVFNAITEIKQ